MRSKGFDLHGLEGGKQRLLNQKLRGSALRWFILPFIKIFCIFLLEKTYSSIRRAFTWQHSQSRRLNMEEWKIMRVIYITRK